MALSAARSMLHLPNAPTLHLRPRYDYAGRASDSGEGRWTIPTAIDEAVPTPVFPPSVSAWSSSGDADFANRALSAVRKEFGGHEEKKKGENSR